MKLTIGVSRYEITTPIDRIINAVIIRNRVKDPLRHINYRVMVVLLEDDKGSLTGVPEYISRTPGYLWFYPPPDREYEVVVQYYDMLVREL